MINIIIANLIKLNCYNIDDLIYETQINIIKCEYYNNDCNNFKIKLNYYYDIAEKYCDYTEKETC